MNNSARFTLRAFVIENTKLDQHSTDLLKNIVSTLSNSLAKDRRMKLNKDDPKQEEDLICDYDIQNSNLISGAMLRIRPSDDMLNIPSSLFDGEKIVLTDLESTSTTPGIVYKDHYYFMLDHRHLVTTLPGNISISRFQTYINWLLIRVRGNTLYEFTPKVTLQPNIKINEIKRIRVLDTEVNESDKNKDEKVGLATVKDISMNFIRSIVSDVKSLDQTVLSEVVSADLIIKFDKPKTMDKDTYQKSLGAFMKPISDTDNIILVPKNGKPINGKDMLRVKKVEVETTDSGKVSEKALNQEMEKFLMELKNENISKR